MALRCLRETRRQLAAFKLNSNLRRSAAGAEEEADVTVNATETHRLRKPLLAHRAPLGLAAAGEKPLAVT